MATPRSSISSQIRVEEHNIGALYEWVIGPTLKVVEDYKASLRRYPNPPAANSTRRIDHGWVRRRLLSQRPRSQELLARIA